MYGHRGRRGARRILSIVLSVGLPVGVVSLLVLNQRSGTAPGEPTGNAPALVGFMGAQDDTLPYAPNRLLVQIRETAIDPSLADVPMNKGRRVAQNKTGLGSLDALARDAGVTGISRPYDVPLNRDKAAGAGADRWFMFQFEDVESLPDLAKQFAALGEVQAVSLDWRALPATLPTDPYYAANWGHDNTAQLPGFNWGGNYAHSREGVGTVGFDADVPQAWSGAQGYGSASVVIAIIDSGVDADHTDLRQVTGYDFGDDDANPDDDAANAGHGTCCAGIAAAMNNGAGTVGVAPGCSIMPLKVADSAGIMYFSAIQRALYYAADHGADIVSISLGVAITDDAATDAALQYAANAGVVLLASTGNGNKADISYPANNPHVIAVGAASPGGERKRSSSVARELNSGVTADPRGTTCDGERWWGSSYGPATKDAAGAVDLLGPTILPTTDIMGRDGTSNDDVEPWFNGTSCAAPYVAGVAALVLSAHPDFTPAQVRDALTSTARDVVNVESISGWDRYAGYGLVNAQAALPDDAPAAPTAAFSATPLTGTAPLAVSFTDASTASATAWTWTFGDGGTSTAQNPTHVYGAAGRYDVSLTVANGAGAHTVTLADYVSVTAAVAAPAAVLQQNQPNPFNPVTQVAFSLPRDGAVRLSVYNLRGQQVAVLAEGELSAGEHVVTWDASAQPSGVYFCRLEGKGISETRKMTLVK
jgi:subtilisin family serine protease